MRQRYASNPEVFRQSVKRCREENPERYRQIDRGKKARRRAQKNGCEVSATDLALVIERSQGNCVMCRSHVPEGLRHIDHIIPLDKGGPHVQENLQLLCYRCNCRKGTKLPEEVTPEVWVKKPRPGQPFLLNPNWK